MRDPEFEPAGKEPAAVAASPVDRFVARLRAHEPAVLAGAAGFQLLVLLAMVVMNTVPWAGSDTVLLRVVPVDPRDLMRGEYVILGYEFSRIPPGEGFRDSPVTPSSWVGQPVYVALTPEADGRHYRGGGFYTSQPPSGRFIRGVHAGGGRINFGIESYYVQEGRGREYEDAVRSRRLSAEVALARDGRAALRGLVIE